MAPQVRGVATLFACARPASPGLALNNPHSLQLCSSTLQTLRNMARQVQGINRFVAIVSSFDRQPYTIPESKRLRPGWRNLREFIKVDHPSPQAQVTIDNKLMDEVGLCGCQNVRGGEGQ
jgi:hypothetical protein